MTQTPTTQPPTIAPPEDFITARADAWRDFEGLEEGTLLKFSILRDLVRLFHAERSRCLAHGLKAEAQNFKNWEARLETLRTGSKFQGPLAEIVAAPEKAGKRTRLLPDALFGAIPKEKFERYDRVWEAAIASEAVQQGWIFWALEVWVDIAQVEEFHRRLGTALSPHGVLLFAENAAAQGGIDTALNLWHGRWTLVLKPKYRTPDFRVREMTGVSEAKGPPSWKLLFQPTRR